MQTFGQAFRNGGGPMSKDRRLPLRNALAVDCPNCTIFLAEGRQVTLAGQFRSVAQCFSRGIACGETMNIADWLRALGLERYEAAFQENSVTVDLLPSLTPDDLKDLGITAVGHRRRLLDAIAALRPAADPAREPYSGVSV